MRKIGTTSSGSVIVEMTTAQFDALAQIRSQETAAAQESPVEYAKMTSAQTVAYVRERIAKLRPKKKDGVARSIAAMFQFNGGIGEQEIGKVIGSLQREKFLVIDQSGHVAYRDA